jgi:hypothetical protein
MIMDNDEQEEWTCIFGWRCGQGIAFAGNGERLSTLKNKMIENRFRKIFIRKNTFLCLRSIVSFRMAEIETKTTISPNFIHPQTYNK